MQLILGILAVYQFVLYPSVGLSTFAIGYIILRLRDKEDPQLGPKALFSYLQMISTQVALASISFILLDIVTDLFPKDSDIWKSALGILIVNVPFAYFFEKLVSYTNVDEKPAARRLFRGLNMAVCFSISTISLSAMMGVLFSDGFKDPFKASFIISAVYLSASYLMLRVYFGIHPEAVLRKK